MTEPVALKYRAFISYSHADGGWAKWLHRGLEGFRIDKALVGRETAMGTIPKALRPIFRDCDDFTAGHTLTEQTLAALDASHSLIVMCSPSSAKSRYVTEEIRLFKSRHPGRPVVPLIVEGKPGDAELECFPSALKFRLDAEGQITKEPVEVLAADAREQGDGKHLALAKVVAGLLGVSSDEVFRRAERDRRLKGRVRNGVIAVLAILVLAASSSAVYAWQQLKTNDAFLSATLKTATEIVETAVTQAERYGVPRAATLALLIKAEGLFDNMAQLGRPTPELRRQKAWMLIEFAHNYRILGNSQQWQARVEQAHMLLAQLAAERPDDVTSERDLSVAQDELGEVLQAQDKIAEALVSYRASLAIAERLAKVDPRNALWQRDLAIRHGHIGDALLHEGDYAAALENYEVAVAISDYQAKAEPGNIQWQRDLSWLYRSVAELERRDDPEAALETMSKTHAILEQLAAQEPNNLEFQWGLGDTDYFIGDLLVQIGADLPAGLERFKSALAITMRIASTDPENTVWQQRLALLHEKIGSMLKFQGKLAGALVSYKTAVAIKERLSEADPANVSWQRDLAWSQRDVANLLAQQGDATQALSVLREARAIIARLIEQSPDDAELTNELASFNSLD